MKTLDAQLRLSLGVIVIAIAGCATVDSASSSPMESAAAVQATEAALMPAETAISRDPLSLEVAFSGEPGLEQALATLVGREVHLTCFPADEGLGSGPVPTVSTNINGEFVAKFDGLSRDQGYSLDRRTWIRESLILDPDVNRKLTCPAKTEIKLNASGTTRVEILLSRPDALSFVIQDSEGSREAGRQVYVEYREEGDGERCGGTLQWTTIDNPAFKPTLIGIGLDLISVQIDGVEYVEHVRLRHGEGMEREIFLTVN